MSGGGIWVPNTEQAKKAGFKDSPEEAFAYVKAAARGRVPESRIRAYLENALKVERWLDEKTHLHYLVVPKYPDYYGRLEGAKAGYRTMEPRRFDARRLGDELKNLRIPTNLISMGGASMSQIDAYVVVGKQPGWQLLVLWRVLTFWTDLPWRFRSKLDRRMTMGTAMAASLRASMLDRNIPLWLDTPFEDLIVEDGRVVGIVAKQGGKTIRIRARRGVVLAAGGFERNQEMREKYLPKPTDSRWPVTPPGSNTGDTIRAGIKAGAAVDLMDLLWGVPVVGEPGGPSQRALFVERSLPGCVIVNKFGKRFVNEAHPYPDLVDEMYRDLEKTGGGVPAWIIIDADFRRKYMFGPMFPGSIQPDSRLPADWLGKVFYRADTLDALADQIGVDKAGLAETVKRMNQYAKDGKDPEFGKGELPIDLYYGDRTHKPNPCLGPIVKPPFYALQVYPGDTGTKGGLLTDEQARVLTEAGQPLPGLYAIGNTSSSVMGPSYPGPGSTLGPAVTFGFVAANHIASVAAAESNSGAISRTAAE
jgi:3-oxosteroid 1-dehydrogenase